MKLSLNHITKSFGEKEVLRDFSFALAEGERVCLLGPSGGGKSTLLNIIAGLVKPDSGELISEWERIGYVFQEYRLLPWLTVEENLTAVTGCGKEQARELLKAVELDGDRAAYPDSLSGGMKQRVNIVRALACEPELLLLDEPFKGLDTALRERVIRNLDPYWQGRALVLVTHDVDEAAMMDCTKVISFG